MTSLLALVASPLFHYLLTLVGVPAAGSLVMWVFNSDTFLGFLGHAMNLAKGFGVAFSMWAKAGPLKAVFGPIIYLCVFAVCAAWAWLDGLLSGLEGDNLKIASALEKALIQGGSIQRLAYIQAKLSPAPTPAEKIQEALNSPANVLSAGEDAVMRQAIEAGAESNAAALAR